MVTQPNSLMDKNIYQTQESGLHFTICLLIVFLDMVVL